MFIFLYIADSGKASSFKVNFNELHKASEVTFQQSNEPWHYKTPYFCLIKMRLKENEVRRTTDL